VKYTVWGDVRPYADRRDSDHVDIVDAVFYLAHTILDAFGTGDSPMVTATYAIADALRKIAAKE
jgi:hypothetical protein